MDSPATSIEAARAHHAEHGDMDGHTCLLVECALHGGFWQLEFIHADKKTSARANVMFIRYLHDLRQSSPNKFKELLVCIRSSLSTKIIEKLNRIPIDVLLPPRETCRKCGSRIEFTEREHGWNIEATKNGYCRALCQEEDGHDEQEKQGEEEAFFHNTPSY